MAITSEDTTEGKALRERLHLTFPLLADPEAKTIRRYGVYDAGNETAWPALVLLDERGRVRWRHSEETYPKRIPTADVLARIDGLNLK